MQRHRTMSVDEYLELEEASDIRHEFLDGMMLAMSGGSFNHNEIAINTRNALKTAAGRNCRGFVSDIRVKTGSGLLTYPDVVLICGNAEQSGPGITATNPVVIGEVLSRSTRNYDLGDKFNHYRSIPSLSDYLLIDQDAIDVEHRWRDGDQWRSARYTNAGDSIALTGVSVTLRLSDLYAGIDLTGTATP